MLQFHFDHIDFNELLKSFASQSGNELRGNTLYFSNSERQGYAFACKLPNGLSILISEHCLDRDIIYHRKKRDECYYILSFDEIYIKSNYYEIINGHKSDRPPPIYSGAVLNSTLFDKFTFSSKGNGLRMVRCLFDSKWMARYLGIKKDDAVLKRYLALRSRNLNFEPIDVEYRNYLDEIFQTEPQNPMFITIAENRIMLLLELFFTRLFEKSNSVRSLQFDNEAVFKMMEVEHALTENFSGNPPTVEEMAARHAIGVSRLKRQFKQIYGKPLYEYYQKYRMEKAKEMLLSGGFTVKETGYKLGYQNLSNFATAFKKEYGILPSKLAK